jgi:hypothetical protein
MKFSCGYNSTRIILCLFTKVWKFLSYMRLSRVWSPMKILQKKVSNYNSICRKHFLLLFTISQKCSLYYSKYDKSFKKLEYTSRKRESRLKSMRSFFVAAYEVLQSNHLRNISLPIRKWSINSTNIS